MRLSKSFLILVSFLLMACEASQQSIEYSSHPFSTESDFSLGIWQLKEGPRVIFPKFKEREFKEGVQEYLRRLKVDSGYHSITQDSSIFPVTDSDSSLSTYPGEEAPLPVAGSDSLQVAVIANGLGMQTHWNGGPMDHLDRALSDYGATGSIVPLGLNLILDERQTATFRNLLMAQFDLLVAAGGADVDPSLYGQENTHSWGTNFVRDSMEVTLIQEWVKNRHPLLGICRGQQIASVALGFSLIQDIPTTYPQLKSRHVGGGYNTHPVDLLPANSSNLLFRILNQDHFDVLSTHHQAVLYQNRPDLMQAARAEVITEAIQSKDETIVLLQFHPEETQAPVGPLLMQGLMEHFKSLKKNP